MAVTVNHTRTNKVPKQDYKDELLHQDHKCLSFLKLPFFAQRLTFESRQYNICMYFFVHWVIYYYSSSTGAATNDYFHYPVIFLCECHLRKISAHLNSDRCVGGRCSLRTMAQTASIVLKNLLQRFGLSDLHLFSEPTSNVL